MLSNEAVQKYKNIFKKEFGQDLTDVEAREQGKRLVLFFKTLIEIDQKKKQRVKF